MRDSAHHRCFNLVIERLLISGLFVKAGETQHTPVSISLSSGFSFQVWNFQKRREGIASFNLVIERLLISGLDQTFLKRFVFDRFNLVIERLLISGLSLDMMRHPHRFEVSISLSSGFSFQVTPSHHLETPYPGFNLVIERLLISGSVPPSSTGRSAKVSISLSSGFSFQGYAPPPRRLGDDVSISLSSGFSFQVLRHRRWKAW